MNNLKEKKDHSFNREDSPGMVTNHEKRPRREEHSRQKEQAVQRAGGGNFHELEEPGEREMRRRSGTRAEQVSQRTA